MNKMAPLILYCFPAPGRAEAAHLMLSINKVDFVLGVPFNAFKTLAVAASNNASCTCAPQFTGWTTASYVATTSSSTGFAPRDWKCCLLAADDACYQARHLLLSVSPKDKAVSYEPRFH